MKKEYTIPTVKCVAIKMRQSILQYNVSGMQNGGSSDVTPSGSLIIDDSDEPQEPSVP